MPSPKLSFVIPCYNDALLLPHAIESCRKQSYANIEIVVVDDGSKDTTPQLMKHYESDARIRYFRYEENKGRSYARNYGNSLAKGDAILVLDADDISYPDRAKLTAKKLQGADFVYGSFDVMNLIGGLLGESTADVWNKEKALKDDPENISRSFLNYMGHSTCAYTKEIAKKYPYPEGEASRLGLDDWAMQIQLALDGVKMDFIPQKVSVYRDIESGVSKKRDKREVYNFKKSFLERLKVPA